MTEPVKTKTPEAEVSQDEPSRLPRRRWLFWLRAAWIICLTPVVFAAVAAFMLIERDITAPSWIVNRVEARAAELLNGGDLQFGAISLFIARDLHPTIRLHDVALRDADDALLARIPFAEGLMSPRGLILKQEVLMQEIRLTGAQLNLRRATDGSVAVAFERDAQTVQQAPSLPELLDQADSFFEQPPLEALETVQADGLVVNFDDARARRSWIVDGGTVALDLRGGETALRGNFALLSGRADVTSVNLSYTSPRGSRAAQIALNIDDAIASDIAAQSAGLTWLADVDAPLSAALRTTLDEEGALGPLNATLSIGRGVLQPNPATNPVSFEAAKAYLIYDPARDRISFSQIALETEWGQLTAIGDAYLREIRDGLPQALLGQFRLSDISMNPAAVYEKPLQLEQAVVDFRLRFAPFSVEVGQAVVIDGDTRMTAKGDVRATDAGWQVAVDAAINQIAPERVVRFWPASVKPGTRSWVSNNLTGGVLFDAEAALRIAPDVPSRFAAEFEFAGSEIRYLSRMPPITDSVGTLTIYDNALSVSLDAGRATPPQGGLMQLAGTSFTIPRLGGAAPQAVLDLRIESTATAIMSVLNQPPFGFIDKANLPVALLDGRAKLAGEIAFPLQPRVAPDEIAFDIGADLAGVRSDILIPDRQIAASNIRVTANPDGITLAGPIRVGAVPTNITWTKAFNDALAGQSQLRGDVELSQRFLDEFGIKLPPGMVGGRGRADLSIDLQDGSPSRLRLTSDLRGVQLALPAVSWSKSPSTAGELVVEGTLGGVPQISSLSVQGGGLRARGRIALTPGGQLDVAEFSQISVGDWLDVPITLRGRGTGNPVAVEIKGGSVDLRRAQFGASGGEGGPLSIALDRLQVAQGIALTGFSGDFNSSGGFSGQFRASVNGGASVQGAVAPRDGRSAVRIRSDDAGGVARAAGFMRGGVGGTLDLTLLPAGGPGTFDGTLAVRDIRLRDAPAMAALLDAISVVGLLQQLDGQGLSFDAVDARFRLSPQQVTIAQSSAVGPGLGISVDGIYTLANKQLDLQGVVSPFYLVNSIGSILTRRGEGLIGFNFNIGGTADAPLVTVNPLSALTPGMFREIFRRPPPVLGQ